MCKKILFNLENMAPDQQQKFDDLFAEINYLNHEQWNALDDPCLMTQEIFNSIQLRRMEIGPELENITTNLFIKYPDYAISYSRRLEKAISSASNSDSFSLDICYKNMRKEILKEFGYDIGPL